MNSSPNAATNGANRTRLQRSNVSPDKTRTIKIYASDTDVARAAACDFVDLVRSHKPLTVALSGGRIAATFFGEIVAQVRNRRVEFANVDFFWADERCVPPTDPESNFQVANEHLFQPLKIGDQRIHRLKGELAPAIAVAQASEELTRPLDLVILGMGEDGHTASLFPNTPQVIKESTATYVHVANSPKPPPNRLSLSYAAIAAANDVWVLVSGAGKKQALQDSLTVRGTCTSIERPSHVSTPLGRVLALRPHSKIYTDIEI
jgi:6-phosphogluconolactonase